MGNSLTLRPKLLELAFLAAAARKGSILDVHHFPAGAIRGAIGPAASLFFY
jgi:hypothetical protein